MRECVKNKKWKKSFCSLLLCLVMLLGLLPFGATTAQAADDWDTHVQKVWQNAVAEFESYGIKGWTDTSTDPEIKKWSGRVANIKEIGDDGTVNGTPQENPMIMPSLANDSYDVYYPEQLRYAMEMVSTAGGTVNLKNSMDLGGMDTNGAEAVEPKLWVPIILNKATTINGEDHTLYNLNVKHVDDMGIPKSSAGFIGYSAALTKINDLHFLSAKIVGGASSAILGSFKNLTNGMSTITNCSFERGLLEVGSTSAGLIGGLGTIANRKTDAFDSHTKNVYVKGSAGCVGNFAAACGGTIKNSYAVDGIVIGNGHSGGFKSCDGNPSVYENCFSNISMYGKTQVGAFIGMVYGGSTFKNCYTSGIVEGQSAVGGFAGASESVAATSMTDCYSTAMVGMEYSTTNLGGFYGTFNTSSTKPSITRCYAAGEVGNINGTAVGTAGFSPSAVTFSNCFYDKQMTGMREVGVKTGVASKRTREMTNPTTPIFGDGTSVAKGANWLYKDKLYPQLKVFSDPEACKAAFGEEADLVMAYSEASASTAFLRDEATKEKPQNYDTVRDIVDVFEFTNNQNAPNNSAGYEWKHDSVRHPDNVKSLVSPGEDILTINRDESNDRVTNMAPGIGWVQVNATVNGITGNRAIRFCPTVSLSLEVANPDLGIGSDVRIYPTLTDKDEEKTYDHRKGVSFIRATAADLAKYDPNNPDTKLPSVAFTGDAYKDVPVIFNKTEIGKANVSIKKVDLEGKTTVKDILVDEDTLSDRETEAFEKLFRGEEPFTKEDYGTYTITYSWLIDQKPMTASKKVYVLPGVTLNYQYNDSDDSTGSADNPKDDLFTSNTVRVDATAVETGTEEDPLKPGMQFNLPEATPTRQGYTFAGWSLKNNTKPEDYAKSPDAFKIGSQAKESLYDKGSIATISVYAVWQPRNYDLQFNYPKDSFGNLGTDTLEGIPYEKSISTTEGKSLPKKLEAGKTIDTEKNQLFLGWSTLNPEDLPTGSDGKPVAQAVNFDEKTILNKTGDPFKYFKGFEHEVDGTNTQIPLYPVFATATGTATFYQNDGTKEADGKTDKIHETQNKSYNDAVTRPATNPSRSGYTFRGWSQTALAPIEKDGTFTEVLKAGDSLKWLGESQSYYAVWERIPYTVSFYKNDGSQEAKAYRSIENKTYGDKLKDTELAGPSRTGYGFNGWATEASATTENFTKNTAVTGNTTLYALWKANRYTVTFYDSSDAEAKAFGDPVKEVPYNTSIKLPQGTPSREGYTFTGWKYKTNGQEKDFTDKTPITADTKVYAVWEKATYDLDIFKTPAATNPNKPDQTLTGIPYGEALGTRLPTAPAYYTDKSGQKYAFTGFVDEKGKTVTKDTVYQKGDLNKDKGKLTGTYNQKVYDIGAEKKGYGSIVSGTGTFKEGDNTVVSWKPDAGYKVSNVMVDGEVRDDLLNSGKAGTVTFKNIKANHKVIVIFEKDNGGSEDPQKWYTITTTKNGGSDASSLTPTATVAAGKDYKVSWQAAAGYRVTSITVDGLAHPLSDSGSIDFTKVGSDHDVVVNIEPIAPDMDTGKTPGFWTITTRQTGGDIENNPSKTTLTPTMVVSKNSDPVINWGVEAESGYRIEAIILDKGTKNERALSTEEIAKGSYTFAAIGTDHTVDVTFSKDGEVIDPSKKLYKVETILTGGPGTITGSAVVPEGGSYVVDWAGPADEHYIVESITVNGEAKDKNDTKEIFENIQTDSRVEVQLKPNLRTIETEKIGDGTISPSKTVFYKESYTVEAKPKDGWYLKRVAFDGETKEFDDPTQTTPATVLSKLNPFKEHIVQADDLIQVVGDQITVPLESIVSDHQIKVTFVEKGKDEIPEEKLCRVKTSIVGGPGTIVGGGTFEKGQSTLISWSDIEAPFVVDTITVSVNGVLDQDLSAQAKKGNLALNDLQSNYDIVVTLKQSDTESGETPPVDPQQRYDVVTRISGAPGAAITASQLGVNEGVDVAIAWQYDSNTYEIKEVKIDGTPVSELKEALSYTFEKLNASHRIEVVLGERTNNPVDPQPGQYSITTGIGSDIGGTIDPSIVVNEGESALIHWQAEAGYEVSTVIVDGIVRDDLRALGNNGQITFDAVNENHQVVVIFKPENSGTDKPENYVVETSYEGKGTITQSTAVKAGTDHTVTFSPDSGYKITRVDIDGVRCDAYITTGKIDFKAISENHRVSVIFEQASTPPVNPDNPNKPENPDNPDQPNNPGNNNKPDNGNTSVNKPTTPGNSSIIPGYPPAQNTERLIAKVGSIAPYTGIVGDIARQQSASASSSYGSHTPLLQQLLGLTDGIGGDGINAQARAMSLIDLIASALCLALTVCAFCFKKHAKWITLLITIAVILLFFGTQPITLSFIIADRYSPAFLILLGVSAVAMLFMGRKEEKEREEETEELV